MKLSKIMSKLTKDEQAKVMTILAQEDKQAYALGVKAYQAGIKRIPVQDRHVMYLLQGIKVGEGAIDIFTAWLKGWDDEAKKPKKFDIRSLPYERKPSTLSEVHNAIPKKDLPKNLKKFSYLELFGNEIDESDKVEQDNILLNFSIDVPQYFMLASRKGLYLVNTEGYKYPRYVIKIL